MRIQTTFESTTLKQFAHVVRTANPEWISEHVAFTRSNEVDLGHLNPVAPTKASLQTVVDHARELMDDCQKPLILENVTSFLRLPGEMSEPEFLNRLCEQSGSGLLLDVTNLLINARNHKFDELEWLAELNPDHIVQLHVVGYSCRDGVWLDYHGAAIQDDLYELIREVVRRTSIRAVIVERDTNFPPVSELARELTRLETECAEARQSRKLQDA
ncbi:MAG: multinuclear nonheme iron-dependent oxidase [Planctomycetales bacterium]